MEKTENKLQEMTRRDFLKSAATGAAALAAWSILPEQVFAQTEDELKITLLGTSDVHGRFMPWDYATDMENRSGSLVQISTAVKEIRKEVKNVLLVDAGDAIQDNSVEQFNKEGQQPMMLAMNAMGYENFTLGNHEFNFGMDVLNRVMKQFNGKVLCGNLYHEDGRRYLPATYVKNVAGVRIGFIGMTTPMTMEFEKGSDHLRGVVLKNPIEETKKAIKELAGKSDVLIGIMHMGIENENGHSGTGLADIVKECPELTAIIGGHLHKKVDGTLINGVLITEPYKWGYALSRLDLTFTKERGKYILKDKQSKTIDMKSYADDTALVALLAPFHERARQTANEVIGEVTGVDLVPVDTLKGISEVQTADTPLTQFFNEVQLFYSGATAVSLCISRDNAAMPVGPIKRKDIAFNYEYTGGETTVYEVTGKDLKDYMEWSAGYFNQMKDGDVTPSYDPKRRASKYSTNDIFGGVGYTIDLREERGSRIKDLMMLKTGKAILPSDTVLLGMNSYRMNQLMAK